ncbi:site-2 protease family protein [Halomarina pelagica]|uniref:site-2 protease family protein n=1 Tax=Halomarina pelagica TaxID=2961599 RepID=UPI0020C4233E|nr:site-2 protease family protein [Halomarina sp. BND7]
MGIPIEIHVSLLVILPFLAWQLASPQYIATWTGIINAISPLSITTDTLLSGSTPWIIGIAGALSLFVGVAIHELGHSWVALRYDLTIRSITLWLFGGVAHIEDLPTEWRKEFWIAIAGPITSLLLGVIGYVLLQVTPPSAPVAGFVFGWFGLTNVGLALFNLLPAFPMDGGRILRALLARSRPFVEATQRAVQVATVVAILLALVGLFTFDILLLLIAGFVFLAGRSEATIVMTQELLSGVRVRDLMRPELPTVRTGTPVQALIDRMLHERRTEYVVVDQSRTVQGVVTLANVQTLPETIDPDTTVDEVMTEDPPTISSDDDAFELFRKIGDTDAHCVLIEEQGRVLGLVSGDDFMQILALLQRSAKLDNALLQPLPSEQSHEFRRSRVD